MKRRSFFSRMGASALEDLLKGRPHGRPFIVPAVWIRVMRSITAGIIVIFANTLLAQRQFSIGADAGMPLGEFADRGSLLLGPVAGVDLTAARSFALTLRGGYTHVVPQSDFSDHYEYWYMIPVQAGVKFFIIERPRGPYLHGQAGMHLVTFQTTDVRAGATVIKGERSSEAHFSYALGAGAQLSHWDMGMRVNAISPSPDASEGARAEIYLALSIAWLPAF